MVLYHEDLNVIVGRHTRNSFRILFGGDHHGVGISDEVPDVQRHSVYVQLIGNTLTPVHICILS